MFTGMAKHWVLFAQFICMANTEHCHGEDKCWLLSFLHSWRANRELGMPRIVPLSPQ